MTVQRVAGLSWHKSSHSTDTGGQCIEVAPVPVQWQRSSHSDNTGGQCVEAAAVMAPVGIWQKSSHSDDTGGACVEVADLASAVAVRDSKDPEGPKLLFDAGAWRAFAGRVKGGELDLS